MKCARHLYPVASLVAVLLILASTGSWAQIIILGDLHFEQAGSQPGDLVGFFATYEDQQCPPYGPIPFMQLPEIVVPLPGVQRMHPRKIVDNINNVHVVWMESNNLQAGWKIMYMEYDNAGTVIVAPFRISDLAFYNAVYPAIDVDSARNSHVVWMAQNIEGGVWDIFYSRVQGGSGADQTIPDVRLSDLDGFDSGRAVMDLIDSGSDTKYIEHPDIAVDRADTVHVVWSDARPLQNLADWEVFYQKQDNSAVPVVAINDMLVSADDGFDSQCPAIDTGRGNRVHIVWQDARDTADWEVYYQKQRPDGTVLIDDRRISGGDDGFDSAMPDIAMEDGPNANDIFGHVAFMDRRDVDPGHSNEPQIHIQDQWEVYSTILKPDGTPAGYGVPKRQSDLYGSWTVYGLYTGPPDGHSMYPQIAVEDDHTNGNTFIKWHDERDGNWEIYETEVHNWCNNPNTDVRVTNNQQPDMYPSIALDSPWEPNGRNPDNKWQHQEDGQWQIYNARKEEDTWIRVTLIQDGQDDHDYDMFPDPFDDDAFDGLQYMVGMPLQVGDYQLRFAVMNPCGAVYVSPIIPGPSIVTGVPGNDSTAPPNRIDLAQNSPNPFNPLTTFVYTLPEPAHVRLTVYDLRGQVVNVIVDQASSAGRHEVTWNGRDRQSAEVPSGSYSVRMEALGEVTSVKILLVR